ncbi:MAG: hypothetical protein AAGC60_03050 [Acidobacteriota bacterium]
MMSIMKPNHPLAAAFRGGCVVLALSLAVVCAPEAHASSDSKEGVAKVDLTTPAGRFAAVRPLISADAKEIARHARSAGIEAKELGFWRELFLSHGREGLLSLSKAGADRMAVEQEGTWKVVARAIHGKKTVQESWLFNEVVELKPDVSKVRILMIDKSVFPSGESNSIVSYGTAVQKTVVGPELGLPEGQTGVHQSYEFDLLGLAYPGFENAAGGMTESLWIRQGDVWRTVFFNVDYTDANGELLREMKVDAVAIETAEEVQVASYPSLDFEETTSRLTPEILLSKPMDHVWKTMIENPDLQDASVWMTRGATDRRLFGTR